MIFSPMHTNTHMFMGGTTRTGTYPSVWLQMQMHVHTFQTTSVRTDTFA